MGREGLGRIESRTTSSSSRSEATVMKRDALQRCPEALRVPGCLAAKSSQGRSFADPRREQSGVTQHDLADLTQRRRVIGLLAGEHAR